MLLVRFLSSTLVVFHDPLAFSLVACDDLVLHELHCSVDVVLCSSTPFTARFRELWVTCTARLDWTGVFVATVVVHDRLDWLDWLLHIVAVTHTPRESRPYGPLLGSVLDDHLFVWQDIGPIFWPLVCSH